MGEDDRIDEEDREGQSDNDSDFSLNSQEMEQLESLLKDKGLAPDKLASENMEEHKKRMSMWFKRSGKASIDLSDE